MPHCGGGGGIAAARRSKAHAKYMAVCRLGGLRISTSTQMYSGRSPTKRSAFCLVEMSRTWHNTAWKWSTNS